MRKTYTILRKNRSLLAMIMVLAVSFSSCLRQGEIRLAAVFSDHMVLQQQSEIALWGWGEPGTMVRVESSWDDRSATAKVGKEGRFECSLHTPEAGGPYCIKVSSVNEILINDVQVGEVWLCSGQSNMEMPMRGYSESDSITGATAAIATSANPQIRFFQVDRNCSFEPAEGNKGQWKLAEPGSVSWFSALSYFFARELQDSLQVPVGIISCSYGGSPLEAWLPLSTAEKNALYGEACRERASELDASGRPEKELQLAMRKWLENARENHIAETSPLPDWSDQGQIWFPDFLGELLFTNDIELKEEHLNADLFLSLGQIDDLAQVRFNDSLLWEELLPSRRNQICEFQVPRELLRQGSNHIVINLVADLWGGGLKGPEQLMFARTESDIGKVWPLTAGWQVRTSFRMEDAGERPREGLAHFQMLSALCNGMLSQVIPYGIRGVAWYQGEGNINDGYAYREKLEDLINSWRREWSGDLPFYYVQIAPFDYDGSRADPSPVLREAQRLCQDIDAARMVVSLDLGLDHNIHPPYKKELGHRLARHAFRDLYGMEELISHGPLVDHSELLDTAIRVHFKESQSPVMLINESNPGFEISGTDSVFYPARVRIEGRTLLAWSEQVDAPLCLRYGWSDTVRASLFNQDGLPASSFLSSNNEIRNRRK